MRKASVLQIQIFVWPRTHIGTVMVVIIWWLDLQLPVQSFPITTKVVSVNPIHGEVYSTQDYVIQFVSLLLQVDGYSPGTPVFSTNKTDCHDITEILLKVALNTITQTIEPIFSTAWYVFVIVKETKTDLHLSVDNTVYINACKQSKENSDVREIN